MYFNREKTLKLCLTAVLLAAVLALCLSPDFYSSAIASIYLSLALFSALIVLQMVRPSWSDLLWAMAGSMFLAVLDYLLMGFHPTLMAFFSFAGLAAFAILGIRTIWAKGEQQKDGWPPSPIREGSLSRVPHFSRSLREVGLLTCLKISFRLGPTLAHHRYDSHSYVGFLLRGKGQRKSPLLAKDARNGAPGISLAPYSNYSTLLQGYWDYSGSFTNYILNNVCQSTSCN